MIQGLVADILLLENCLEAVTGVGFDVVEKSAEKLKVRRR